MTIDDLLTIISSQPEVLENRVVAVWGDKLRAEVEAGRIRQLDEIACHPDQTNESKTFRYRHLVGPPCSLVEIEALLARFPSHRLPRDLVDLLARVDGVHFWADLDQGRSYFGLAPAAEWEDAATSGWAALFRAPPVGHLVISYHQNGDYYLVLDTVEAKYWWFNLEDFDNPTAIGNTISDALDWLWSEAPALRP